nr:hypothetical protein [Tanacetum cinerariifolium]
MFCSVTTYRHKEENDHLLVYVSPALVATTKQSAEPDGLPIKLYSSDTYNDYDAPGDALGGFDSPLASLGGFDAPSDAPVGSDSLPTSPPPELDRPIAL